MNVRIQRLPPRPVITWPGEVIGSAVCSPTVEEVRSGPEVDQVDFLDAEFRREGFDLPRVGVEVTSLVEADSGIHRGGGVSTLQREFTAGGCGGVGGGEEVGREGGFVWEEGVVVCL